MTISLRMPLVSGRRVIFAGSVPAMQAAACKINPELAPADTNAASAPSMRALAAAAGACRSRARAATGSRQALPSQRADRGLKRGDGLLDDRVGVAGAHERAGAV